MTKLEKLLANQAALAKQIDELRKAETQAKKAAAATLAESRKAAVLRAVERAGLLDFDSDLLAAEFEKVAQRLTSLPSEKPTAPASPIPASDASTFENGE